MRFRKLILGVSVLGLIITAGTALAQQSRKPTATIRATTVTPAQSQVSAPSNSPVNVTDALDPVDFKPAPMDFYEAAGGPQVMYPQAGLPVPPYVPHMAVATRVVAAEEGYAAPSLPAPPHVYCAAPSIPAIVPPPSHLPGHPMASPVAHCPPMAQYPTAAPAVAPYAPPGCAYPAPPAEFNVVAPPYSHCIMAPRPLAKSELLHIALCHLEAAGAEDLAKQVRIEVATEEKCELAAELSRKEAELQALKSDIDRLRAQVSGPSDEAKPASPQVQVKVQVLELDLAKIKAAGIELPPGACSSNAAKAAECQCAAAGEGKTAVCPTMTKDLAQWMSRKSAEPVCVHASPVACVIDSREELTCFIDSLRKAEAVKVLAEPCLVAPSGKRTRFCCGAGDEAHLHSAIKPCEFCATSGFDLDLVATVIEADQIRTDVTMRHRAPLVLPANTAGLEGPLPQAVRKTEMCSSFIARSGQTFVSSIRRQASCTENCPAEEATDGNSDEKVAVNEKAKESLCLILVTPCLVENAKCPACSQSACKSACKCETQCKCESNCKCAADRKCAVQCQCEEKSECKAACKTECKSDCRCDCSQKESACKCEEKGSCDDQCAEKCKCTANEVKPAEFKSFSADGARMRMMREPFLKDIATVIEIEVDDVEFDVAQPKFGEQSCPECQRKRLEATKPAVPSEPAAKDENEVLKAAFHYYRPGEISTDSTPRHWGAYPPERPITFGGVTFNR